MAMTGKLMPAKAHGTNESILFARASSKAAALKGSGKICRRRELLTGTPGSMWAPLVCATDLMRWGESKGDENDRRYRAMKKISLRAHTVKSTVYASKVSRWSRKWLSWAEGYEGRTLFV